MKKLRTRFSKMLRTTEKVRTATSKWLMRIPDWVLLMTKIIACILEGTFISKVNLKEPSLINQFSMTIFWAILMLYVWWVISKFIGRTAEKTFRAKSCDREYNHNLEKTLRSKMPDIQKVSSGKIFGVVTCLSTMKGMIVMAFINMIPFIVPFCTLIYKEAMYDWRMAVVSIACVILCFTLGMLTDKMFGWSTEVAETKSVLAAVTADNFTNVKTIKCLRQESFAMKRLRQRQQDADVRSVNTFAILWYRAIEIIGLLPLFVNVYMGRNDSEMIALILLSHYALECVANNLIDISEAVIEYRSQKKILDPLKGDDVRDRAILKSSIVLDNVEFDYGKNTETFTINHLEFPYGSRTLITGESGEGKSSLANLLTGGISPTKGTVPLYLSYYIWQETEILDDTLWNNIVFDNPENISEEEIMELFKKLNMMKWFSTLQKGFDTLVGERGCRLSSGQKQRLNIIRLVLNMRYHPDYTFIIDEITSNLDSVTRDLAISLIDENCHSTLICVSHNDGFDRICQKHIVVEKHQFIPIA